MAPGADEAAERVETMRIVLEELQRLPQAQRRALTQRFVEGLGPADIAQRGNTAPSTVRAHIARGLATLRERLDRRSGGRAAWAVTLAPWGEGSGPTVAISSGATFMTWKTAVGLVPLIWFGIWASRAPADADLPLQPPELTTGSSSSPDALAGVVSTPGHRSPVEAAIVAAEGPARSAQSNATDGGTITVSGAVVDALTGEPVPAIGLTIRPDQYVLPAGHPRVPDLGTGEQPAVLVPMRGGKGTGVANTTVRVTTGSDGSFASHQGLAPGRVRVNENDLGAGRPILNYGSKQTFPFADPIAVHVGPTFRLESSAPPGVPWDELTGSFASRADNGMRTMQAKIRGTEKPWIRFPFPVTDLEGDGPWPVEFFDTDGLWRARAEVTHKIGIAPRPVTLDFRHFGALEFVASRQSSGLLPTGAITLTPESDALPQRVYLNESEDGSRSTAHARFLEEGSYRWARGSRTGEANVVAGEVITILLDTTGPASARRPVFSTEILIDATAAPDVDLSDFQFSIVATDDLLRGFSRSPIHVEGDPPGQWRLVLDGLPDERWNVMPKDQARILRWEPDRTVIEIGTAPATFIARPPAKKVSVRITVIDGATREPLPKAEGMICTDGLSYIQSLANSVGQITSTPVPSDLQSHAFVSAPGYGAAPVRFTPDVDGTRFEIALERGWRAAVRVLRTEDLGLMQGVEILVNGESRGSTNEYGLLWIEGEGPPSMIQLGAGSEDFEVILSPFEPTAAFTTAPLVGYTFVLRRR